MKKILLSLSLCFCLSFQLHAQQQLPNSGFETWQNAGNNDEEPTNWNSNKTGGGFAALGPQTCFREGSGVYAGSYCVKLETGRILGNNVNGTVTTGKLEAPNTNPNNGYAHTVRADADFNSPFTGRPDSLVGYYKYTSVSGDAGALQVILHGDADVRMPDPNNTTTAFVVGEAAFDTPASSVGSWTRFSVPFVYNNTDTPKYVLAIFTASAVIANSAEGSILWVDGVEMVYNAPPCANTSAMITLAACDSQMSPSGKYTWTTTGMYNDTLPNAGGCDSIITVDLTVDSIDVTINVLSAYFWVNDTTADSYQWLQCDSGFAVIPGANGSTFSAPLAEGYAVEIRKGSCIDTSICILASPVSIDKNDFAEDIRLHTLPSGEGYEIDLAQRYAQVTVQVVDLQGREVWREAFTQTQTLSLNLQALPPAIYIAKILADGKTTAVKLIR